MNSARTGRPSLQAMFAHCAPVRPRRRNQMALDRAWSSAVWGLGPGLAQAVVRLSLLATPSSHHFTSHHLAITSTHHQSSIIILIALSSTSKHGLFDPGAPQLPPAFVVLPPRVFSPPSSSLGAGSPFSNVFNSLGSPLKVSKNRSL